MIKSELLSESQMASLQDECTQLCNIIGKSIVTAKSKRQLKKTALPENVWANTKRFGCEDLVF